MRRTSGFTLLEALIALAIFGLIMVMATEGVTSALRAQGLNEAVTSSQARLRRVTEVFTQELRSAVLGGVVNWPYPSNATQVSFLTLTGGAGDPVLPHDYGQGNSFEHANNYFLQAGTGASSLAGQFVLLTNANGDAITFKVTNVSNDGSGKVDVVHAGCANTIPYTGTKSMSMTSRAVGFRFDAGDHTLYMKEGDNAEVPVAFDLRSVAIDYVYQLDDGSIDVLSTPLVDASNTPLRNGTINGQSATLARVGLVLSAADSTGHGAATRRVSGDVEMSSSHSFTLNRVTTCVN